MNAKIKGILINLALIIAAFTIQNSIFPLIPFLKSTPNLLLILTFSFGYIEGKRAGMMYGLLAGILLDLFYSGPFGFYTLFYIIMGYLNGICTQYYYEDYLPFPLFLCVVNELAYNMYIYVFRFLIRGRLNFLYFFWNLMVPEIILTVVTTLVLYRLILYINRRLREIESRRETTIV